MLIIVLLKRSTFSFTLVFKNARCQSNTFVLRAQCLHLYSARPPAVRWGINNSQIKFHINYLMVTVWMGTRPNSGNGFM